MAALDDKIRSLDSEDIQEMNQKLFPAGNIYNEGHAMISLVEQVCNDRTASVEKYIRAMNPKSNSICDLSLLALGAIISGSYSPRMSKLFDVLETEHTDATSLLTVGAAITHCDPHDLKQKMKDSLSCTEGNELPAALLAVTSAFSRTPIYSVLKYFTSFHEYRSYPWNHALLTFGGIVGNLSNEQMLMRYNNRLITPYGSAAVLAAAAVPGVTPFSFELYADTYGGNDERSLRGAYNGNAKALATIALLYALKNDMEETSKNISLIVSSPQKIAS